VLVDALRVGQRALNGELARDEGAQALLVPEQLSKAAIAAETTAIVGKGDGNRVLPVTVAMMLCACVMTAATILGSLRMASERWIDLLGCN